MPPSSNRPDPAAKTTQRSGIGPNSGSSGNRPERALEANSKSPKAHSAKAPPPQSLLSERRTVPAAQNVQRSGNGPQRALEANSKSPKAHSAKAPPPQSLLSERRTVPEAYNVQRSGNGPERALEANIKSPKAHSATAPPSLEPTQRAEDRSRGPKRTAEREWSGASLGGEQQKPPSAQRDSSSFPRAYSASRGPFPRSISLHKHTADR